MTSEEFRHALDKRLDLLGEKIADDLTSNEWRRIGKRMLKMYGAVVAFPLAGIASGAVFLLAAVSMSMIIIVTTPASFLEAQIRRLAAKVKG